MAPLGVGGQAKRAADFSMSVKRPEISGHRDAAASVRELGKTGKTKKESVMKGLLPNSISTIRKDHKEHKDRRFF